MKKMYVFLVCMCVLTVVPSKAQESNKPVKGALLLETGFSPFSENGIRLQDGQIKGVYMMSDKVGLRAGLGFRSGFASSDNGLTGEDREKSSASASEVRFTPGLMRFFPGSEKLSTYVGAELILATAFNKTTSEADDYKQVIRNSDRPLNGYGVGVFSGFNWYFAKTLYVGAEINISLQGNSVKHSKTETTTDGSKETVEPAKDKFRSGKFETSCNPYIRLGWSF
jgi:hypothetical protein